VQQYASRVGQAVWYLDSSSFSAINRRFSIDASISASRALSVASCRAARLLNPSWSASIGLAGCKRVRSMPNHDFESVSVASVERLPVNPHDSLAHNDEEQTKGRADKRGFRD